MDQVTRAGTLITRLREHGYRVTPQRVAIINTIVGHVGHPTVEEVHALVQQDFPMTSLATVYKTVSLLKEIDEVLELHTSDDVRHVDGRSPDPHPHLICKTCGKIVDLEGIDVSDTIARIAAQTSYTEISNRADFWGLCPDCRTKQPN
jgi:Fur family peroxide stress response transcriptional regulator